MKGIGIPYEVLVVDDGSNDDDKVWLSSISSETIVLLEHPCNAGYGAAIKTGLLNSQNDWVGIVDADGSYDLSAIPKLINEAARGFDMVIAERANIRKMDSPVKRFFRSILKMIVWLMVDQTIDDLNSGLRIMRKSSVMEFFPFLCTSFSFTTSLTILFAERGLFLKFVSTNYSDRSGSSKVRNFRDSLRALQMVVQGITFFNPIKCFVFLSVLMIFVVCIPAMVVALCGMFTLSLYLMVFGSVVTVLIAMGILGDIVRISVLKGMRNNEEERE